MAYCALSDLEDDYSADELAKYADFDGDGSADAAAIGDAISDADAHIDSYLGVVFTVPVSPVPAVLRKRSVTLAMYFLQLRRQSVTDDMQKEFDRITKWLEAVVAGKVTLGTASAPTEASGAGGVDYSVQDRKFGRGEPL